MNTERRKKLEVDMTSPTTVEKVMRANAVMAGVVALAEHYPEFVPLDARPTPAADYLYDAIIIASLRGPKHAEKGLQDFGVFMLTEVLEGRVVADMPSRLLKDSNVLRSVRALFKKGVTEPVILSKAASTWVSPVGKLDDVHMNFVLRANGSKCAEAFVRAGVVKLVHTRIALHHAAYDWWHGLGTAIRYFSYGYMCKEWLEQPTLKNPHESTLGESERTDAWEAFRASLTDCERRLWAYEEKLFVVLADCIGHRAGQSPLRKDGWVYPSLQ